MHLNWIANAKPHPRQLRLWNQLLQGSGHLVNLMVAEVEQLGVGALNIIQTIVNTTKKDISRNNIIVNLRY